jgi:hypothetical protein
VLRVERDTGLGKLLLWPPRESIDLTNATLCVRSYRNYGSAHALPGNFKIARAGEPTGAIAWQAAWSLDGGQDAQPTVAWVSRSGNVGVDCLLGTAASEPLRFSDCQSNWCRFEVCSDHDAASGRVDLRARWTQVAGSREAESRLGAPGQYGPDCTPEATRTAAIVGPIAVAEFASVCCPETRGGALYLSHVMAARIGYDPGFWIGPAVEIEGTEWAPGP